MAKRHPISPEHTAVRTALWRALHVILDDKPHVFADELGAKIIAEENWRNRPDMGADFSKSMRASIVGRARLIEDLVEERFNQGVIQYVILGAGLDTFAFRKSKLTAQMQVFEVDQPGPQTWKRQRLADLGMTVPSGLHFVPVDFETGQSWWDELIKAGFDKNKSAIIVSTGVSMYLSKDANVATLKQVARLAPNSSFAMTFMLALDLLEPKEKSIMEFVMNKAKKSGTPFLSLFKPEDIIALAKSSGFKKAEYVSARELFERYFAKRTDGLNAGNAEAFLIAST
jgi:methyltransferase (TIGR00027 family)